MNESNEIKTPCRTCKHCLLFNDTEETFQIKFGPDQDFLPIYSLISGFCKKTMSTNYNIYECTAYDKREHNFKNRKSKEILKFKLKTKLKKR